MRPERSRSQHTKTSGDPTIMMRIPENSSITVKNTDMSIGLSIG